MDSKVTMYLYCTNRPLRTAVLSGGDVRIDRPSYRTTSTGTGNGRTTVRVRVLLPVPVLKYQYGTSTRVLVL